MLEESKLTGQRPNLRHSLFHLNKVQKSLKQLPSEIVREGSNANIPHPTIFDEFLDQSVEIVTTPEFQRWVQILNTASAE